MRLNDGSRRSGAFELRVRPPAVIQDLGGSEAAMSSPLGFHTCPGARRTRQAAACTGMRLNDGSRRTGASELRVWHPPVIQDLGGNEAPMSSPLASTHALEPDAHVRRPHAPACA